MSKKGITLITAIISIMIIIILLTTAVVSIKNTVEYTQVRAFASELSMLQGVVYEYANDENSDYYLKDIEFNLADVDSNIIDTQFAGETIVNDSITLHTIDYSKLGIENLTRGKATDESTLDIYAVSSTTNKVYYLAGFNSGSLKYYSLTSDLERMVNGELGQPQFDSNKGILFELSETEYTNQAITVVVKIPSAYANIGVTATNGILYAQQADADGYKVYNVNTENVKTNYIINVTYNKPGELSASTAQCRILNFDETAPEISAAVFINVSEGVRYRTIKDISTSDDESGVDIVKYAKGEIPANMIQAYFESSGTKVKSNSIYVGNTSDEVFTLYAKDKAGNYGFCYANIEKTTTIQGPYLSKAIAAEPIATVEPGQNVYFKVAFIGSDSLTSSAVTDAIETNYINQSVLDTVTISDFDLDAETQSGFFWVEISHIISDTTVYNNRITLPSSLGIAAQTSNTYTVQAIERTTTIQGPYLSQVIAAAPIDTVYSSQVVFFKVDFVGNNTLTQEEVKAAIRANYVNQSVIDDVTITAFTINAETQSGSFWVKISHAVIPSTVHNNRIILPATLGIAAQTSNTYTVQPIERTTTIQGPYSSKVIAAQPIDRVYSYTYSGGTVYFKVDFVGNNSLTIAEVKNAIETNYVNQSVLSKATILDFALDADTQSGSFWVCISHKYTSSIVNNNRIMLPSSLGIAQATSNNYTIKPDPRTITISGPSSGSISKNAAIQFRVYVTGCEEEPSIYISSGISLHGTGYKSFNGSTAYAVDDYPADNFSSLREGYVITFTAEARDRWGSVYSETISYTITE